MPRTITTSRELRKWIDEMTAGWAEKPDHDMNALTEMIRIGKHPDWGTDWSAFLDSLPSLSNMLHA